MSNDGFCHTDFRSAIFALWQMPDDLLHVSVLPYSYNHRYQQELVKFMMNVNWLMYVIFIMHSPRDRNVK